MALFVFVLDMCKEDGGVFTVQHGPEPEEVYAALLADPLPTFRAVRIHQQRTSLYFVQLASRPDWSKLQDKVARMQRLQLGPTASIVKCRVWTLQPDEEEVFRKTLVGQLPPEEWIWLQPQPEDLMDITMLVRMPFAAPLWEEDIPLAIPMAVDPAVTMAPDVPTSKGGPAKRTGSAGREPGLMPLMASTMGAVLTMTMATMAAVGLAVMATAVRQPSPGGLRSRLAGLASSIAGAAGAGGHKSGLGVHLAVRPGFSALGALGGAAILQAS